MQREYTAELLARFWAKVEVSGECWIWTASLGNGGHGQFAVNKRPIAAHRVAWEIVNGPIPPDHWIRHRCENARCCNPAHCELFSRNLADRFWNKVDRSGDCWPWLGCIRPDGYGMVGVHGKKSSAAPRVAWELTHGPIPDGMMVCHRCDNPTCVNPAHLFLGTAGDNARDRSEKGRTSRDSRNVGSAHGLAKLTEDSVREMRLRHSAGESCNSLAKAYGVGAETARLAIIGRRWKHV